MTKKDTKDTNRDFELQVSELIDGYRNRVDRASVAAALRTQAELVDRDASWLGNRDNLSYDPDDLDDPRANPLGARPAPKEATRADEATAPEPDSGAIQDRLAAQSNLSDDDIGDDVPPADRDAVKAKRGMERSEDQHGRADKETYDPTLAKRKGK